MDTILRKDYKGTKYPSDTTVFGSKNGIVCIKRPRLIYVCYCMQASVSLDFVESVDPNFSKPAIFHMYISWEEDIYECEKLIKRLNFLRPKGCQHYKYIIHIPRECEDLLPIVNEVYGKSFGNTIDIYCEKYIGSYRLNDLSYLVPSIDPVSRIFEVNIKMYSRPIMSEKKGFIKNDLEEENPDQYKDKIIANFKATTPMGILKTFKDEDDIWGYIIKDKEWRRHRRDHDNKKSLNKPNQNLVDGITAKLNEKNNSMIDNIIQETLKGKYDKMFE